jgi:hypothetical protein
LAGGVVFVLGLGVAMARRGNGVNRRGRNWQRFGDL